MKAKKFFLLSVLVLGLSSCIVQGPKYSEFGSVTNYSNYDLFITEATSVSFEYQPLGSVTSYVESGYSSGYVRSGDFILATSDAAIRVLADEAKKIGAYGIINVKVVFNNRWDAQAKMYIPSYTATGMAIKWQQ